MTQNTLTKLYPFDSTCRYKLVVSQKKGITCNSTHNAEKKSSGNFPSSYLQLNVNKENKTLYTYYQDLKNAPSEDDIRDGLKRLRKDLDLQ